MSSIEGSPDDCIVADIAYLRGGVTPGVVVVVAGGMEIVVGTVISGMGGLVIGVTIAGAGAEGSFEMVTRPGVTIG